MAPTVRTLSGRVGGGDGGGGGEKGYLCHVVTTLILLPTLWFENLKRWRQITQENIELRGGLKNF